MAIKKIDHNKMGRSNLGWLNSWFHFSFAEYYNPENIHFGNLRVVNDDTIQPHTGFSTHPHDNMEIVTYVIEGELTHGDSMDNVHTLHRGDFQYMSAGTGIWHSEMNNGDKVLRLFQSWILPDHMGYTPQYGDKSVPWEERENKLLNIVSGEDGKAPIKIHQDMNMYVSEIKDGKEIDFKVPEDRQVYFIVIEGNADINGVKLTEKDAAEITEDFTIKAEDYAHIIMYEMRRY